MSNLYTLNDKGEPVPEPDASSWSTWYHYNREMCRVDKTEIGKAKISTVFLGVDHNWVTHHNPVSAPILWETMVFGGKLDQEQDRCSGSREQAQAMHARMVKRVKDVE